MKYREGIVVGLDPVELFKRELEPAETKIWMPLLRELCWEEVEWAANRTLPRKVCKPQRGENAAIDHLILLIEEIFETTAIGIWCNWYRSGKDWTPEHQDQYEAHVFTYSFGASRNFYFKSLETGLLTEYLLEDGDLMYFSPEHDANHKHCVPRSAEDGDRISIVIFTDEPYSRRSMEKIDQEQQSLMVTSFVSQLERLNPYMWQSFHNGETITLDTPEGKTQFRMRDGQLEIW